jgi:hypothetical protein
VESIDWDTVNDPPAGGLERAALPEEMAKGSVVQRAASVDGQESTSPDERMRLPEFLQVVAPVALPVMMLWLSAYATLVAAARRLDGTDLGAAATCVVLFLIFDAASGPRRPPALDVGLVTLAFLVAAPLLSFIFHIRFATLVLLAPSILASGFRLRSSRLPSPGGLSLGVPALGGLVRIVTGVGLVASGLGLNGILLSLLAAEMTMLLLDPVVRRAASHRPPAASVARDPSPITPASIGAFGVTLAVFAHVDVLLAQHGLPEGAAGAYAGAGVVARILLFIAVGATLALAGLIAPIRSGDPFRWVRQWIARGAAGALVSGAVLVALRDPVLRVFLGGGAGSATGAFPFNVVGVGLLAIVVQLSFFHRVVDSKAHILMMVGVLLEIALVTALPTTADRIAAAMLAANGFTAILLYQASWAITRWSPPLSLLRSHEEVGSDAAATEPVDAVELSIIVPCHNSGPALRDFLARLEGELSAASSYEIIVVSDGSTDETLATARELASPTLRVVHYPERSGKGHALRVGLSRARGRYVGFIDSDGDIDPQAIGPFLTLMRTYEPDIVLGSKRHPMSQVVYPPLRRIMSWVYHKLTRLLFRVNVRDTQTGLKVVRREVLTAVLPRMFEKRYAWDLELLVVARTLGFTKVFEAPVRIEYQFSSQVDPSAAFRIILDSIAVFYRRYILNSYRHTADRLAVIREPQVRA